MTNEVVVRFEVKRRSDVPQVGARKSVRVNGRMETLYIRHVNVAVRKWQDDDGHIEVLYQGTATMGDHGSLFCIR